MKKIKILLAAALIGVCTFGFMGCGDSSNQDNGYAGDTAESEELYEEEEPDDPYVDGMTLEEAREWAQTECSVFVLKDDLYYPLIPGFVIEPGRVICVSNDYTDYKLPVLTKDAKLVEVVEENEDLYCERLSGESGWTIPCAFCCSEKGDESLEFRQWTSSLSRNSEIPDDVEVRSINGESLDYQKIEKALEQLYELYEKKEEENMYSKEWELGDTTDWESLYAELKMKPYAIQFDYGSPKVSAFLDTTKGAEVELAYRSENSVNTETVSVNADYKYYNLPTNRTATKESPKYSNKYTQTEDGYSIIETGEFESGTYAIPYASILDIDSFDAFIDFNGKVYLFEVQ